MKYPVLVSLLLPLTVSLASCGAFSGTDECNDGADNDNDGLIDGQDHGCTLNGDKESPDPVLTACNDFVDNDADGLIDLEDPGCDSELDESEENQPVSACQDGIDNDEDGLTDFPNDPGCTLPFVDSEEDTCPDGESCPACSNGVDDDMDGQADYPDDLGCASAGDVDEFNADPSICGAAVLIQPLPSDGIALGRFTGSAPNELISNGCGGSGEEHVYVYDATGPQTLRITTDFDETEADTVVYIRTECRETNTELGCNDDAGLGVSTLNINRIEAGSYFIIVDTASSSAQGDYKLAVEAFVPEKEPCIPAGLACAPGLECRQFTEGGLTSLSTTCERPECSDGEDSDGDGLVDFPDEPGCQAPEDNDETDDCPSGVGCPLCSDGIDNDEDLLIDYPNDPGCETAAENLEIDDCTPGSPVLELTDFGATGTTTAVNDNFDPSCDTATAGEHIYGYRHTRGLASLQFSTIGSVGDTVLSVRETDCGSGAAELACEDPGTGGEAITINNPTLDAFYFVFVDSDFSDPLEYILNVSGTIAPGDVCDQVDTQFVCSAGFLCGMTDTCVATECNDGITNDGDALVDFLDPGCQNIDDNDESDDPSPLPQCADGIDNDGDLLIDFPADPGCLLASDNTEIDCEDSDPIVDIIASETTGTTAGATDDFSPSCSGSSLAPEVTHALDVPSPLSSLTLTTDNSSYDTVLYLKAAECVVADLDCNDDGGEGTRSLITLTNVAPGPYFVFVDGFSSNSGDYILTITGTIEPDGVCDPAEEASGLFVCSAGQGCVGNVCTNTQCLDGVDNDGDLLVDEFDPGCQSIDDNDESDDPNPLPECADGIDNDADALIDFPDDPGCEMASDNLEIDDCIAGVPLLELSDIGASGTTTSAVDNFDPSCDSFTTGEDVYGYRNTRSLASLEFSTIGSVGDTVLSVRENDCADPLTEIACEDPGVGGEIVSVPNPALDGSYFVFVDTDFSTTADYVLNVSGTILPTEACVQGDTQFVCSAGFVCGVGDTCVPTECNDGITNDGDALVDAFDPGCLNIDDNDESDDPLILPECADGIDNDGDTLIDFPDDLACSRASDDVEIDCEDTDAIVDLTMSTITGTTTGATNDFTPSCQTNTTAPEIAHRIIFPGALETLTVTTDGSSFDTVLYMRAPVCSVDDLICDDDDGLGTQSLFTATDVAAGQYFIMVDGYQANAGAYTLDISGVIASGEACDMDQIAAGILTCSTGTTCMAAICQ